MFTIMCTDTRLLTGKMSLSSSLLLSLLLGATDVDGVLELEKYDIPVSILKPRKSRLNLTSRFNYYKQSRLTLSLLYHLTCSK